MYALLQRPVLTATAAGTGQPVYQGGQDCLKNVFRRDASPAILALACFKTHAAWLQSTRAP